MKIYAPSCYDKFKCIADKCKHSCCVGWEIDIDGETLERYAALEGEFGDRLRKNISFNADCPHFINDDSEKCPFLNNRRLCDIITELGEDALCEICDSHPRYRNFFSDRVEIGLGLCCEAAAELALSATTTAKLVELDESDGEGEQASAEEIEFFEARDRLLGIVQDRSIPVFERLTRAQDDFGVSCAALGEEAIARLFASLEYIDEEFGAKVYEAFTVNEITNIEVEWEIPLEQLAVYFIMRHTADGLYGDDLPQRVAFCALCVEAVYRVCAIRMRADGLPFFEALCDTARAFSSEIEYSMENTERLIEAMGELVV